MIQKNKKENNKEEIQKNEKKRNRLEQEDEAPVRALQGLTNSSSAQDKVNSSNDQNNTPAQEVWMTSLNPLIKFTSMRHLGGSVG